MGDSKGHLWSLHTIQGGLPLTRLGLLHHETPATIWVQQETITPNEKQVCKALAGAEEYIPQMVLLSYL